MVLEQTSPWKTPTFWLVLSGFSQTSIPLKFGTQQRGIFRYLMVSSASNSIPSPRCCLTIYDQIRSVHMMPWHTFIDNSLGFGKEQPTLQDMAAVLVGVFLKTVGPSAALQGVSFHVRLKRLHTLFNTYGVQSSFMVAIERCTELHKRPISIPNPTAWTLSDSTCQTHPNTQTKETGIQDHLGMHLWRLFR